MDGSYEPSGRFPGYGDGFHHRHSQSTTTLPTNHNHHLSFHYAAHATAHAQLSSPVMSHMGDATRMPQVDNPYKSHDDLCIDQCMGVGIYGGFQQYNHRSAPMGVQARWQGGLLPVRDNMLAHQDYSTIGFDTTIPFQQHQQQQQSQHQHQHQHQQQLLQQQQQYSHQHQPQPQPQQFQQHNQSHQQFNADISLSASHQYQSFFNQSHQPHAITAASMSLCEDEDCQSVDDSECCDSQCTMTGKCTAPECETEDDACYDQNCPSRPDLVTEEVRDGAAALISINHAPEPSQNLDFQQESLMNHLNINLSSHAQDNFLFASSFLPDSVGLMANHILNAHAGSNPSSCTRPCPLDDPQNYRFCHMPVYPNNTDFFKQYSNVDSNLQMNSTRLVECGAEITDPDAFTTHFFEQHKDLFTAGLANFSPGLNSSNGFGGKSSEIMSPMAPPLDASDASPFSGTPSPLTPTLNNIDMPDVKPTDLSHSRSESVTSSGDNNSVNIASSEEHRCMWREEGSREICGLVFSDAEALFRHASNSHIKHAQKGAQGFRCGWDDCPRSEPGQTGFPQRSKIERHMQTHIGHKPHICEICNKGFSAKQALTQHMFIHSNEKPLVCHICHKAFRYPSALTMHQRVHTGAKPLRCPICNKGFSESSNLSKHKRTHEVKGRFNCPVLGCDRNFHRQDQLRRHMKTHPSQGGSDESRSSEAPEATPSEISFDQSFQT
ncbi:zinc-responsive transcriptional regulator ZAP1 [Podospora fimiseda]|uniref:Zinc-responsive transcriptional regulator ZAP1 n=1 Tax=Podospora fimiseda TaxID=252190 RepID=A0AAN7GUE9_9PEZI|nr:zinc-responsive transcriptional regulator ZAP1 [Podospora fimiseda]